MSFSPGGAQPLQGGARPLPLVSSAALITRLLFTPRAHGRGHGPLALLFEILGKVVFTLKGDWGCAADFK